MTTEKTVEKPAARLSLFAHGESVVASMGFAVATILLVAVGAAAWWTLRAQRACMEAARIEQVETVGKLLSQPAERMLTANQITAVRRLVAEAARNYELSRCRIVLSDGQVIADEDPAKISVQDLPAQWSGTYPVTESEPSSETAISASFPLAVPQRGSARLDLAGEVRYPAWVYYETQAGVGAIGVAALGSLMLVYRRIRGRLQAVGAIREALLCYEDGGAAPATLAVHSSLGAEANAWNKLLDDYKQLRKQITVQRARESLESRREVRGELAAACDALSRGMILVDERGRAKFVNGAAAVFLKVTREEILDTEVAQFIQNDKVAEAVRGAASGSGRGRATVEVAQGDGPGSGVLRFSVRPVRSKDAAAALIIIDDITQQRVAEEARNSFLAQATHELRTPLTNIRLYVETALEEGEEDPAMRAKCLNVINQESRRLERMVGDILSVSEIEAGSIKIRKDDVHIAAMFEELKADYDAQAKEKQTALSFDLPPKFPAMQGDRDKIDLALHNLIGNALKYTPAGGEVLVTVDADANHLTVEVTDSGIGISEDDAKHIFEKFYRAKDRRVTGITGSGLGLGLAREVVRLHGGDITVQSELDKGSTFTLTLPIQPEAVQNEDSRAKARSGVGA